MKKYKFHTSLSMKKLLFILFVFFSLGIKAQNKIDSLSIDSLHDVEIRLMGLSERMIQSYDEEERMTSGKNFIRTLVRAIKVQGSYYYPFDSLKAVSIIQSPDNLFRIMTWNLGTNEEEFHYYGLIQMNPDKMKKIKDTTNLRAFYPLIDRSSKINNPYDTITSADFWWGSNYYQMALSKAGKTTFYTILGWDGNTNRSNKKVVDVLTFQNNKPVFGAPIFDVKGKKLLKRMIWEFSNQATMTLRYEEKKNMLIYENIVPPKPSNLGMYETYLPDGSYDFMVWKNGKWQITGELTDFKMK
ncbi:MAG: hypothetical protein NTU43_03130 [Bacteroidetes bacterium]|nr:hypothetical protein [Bacteroidota bacterium]